MMRRYFFLPPFLVEILPSLKHLLHAFPLSLLQTEQVKSRNEAHQTPFTNHVIFKILCLCFFHFDQKCINTKSFRKLARANSKYELGCSPRLRAGILRNKMEVPPSFRPHWIFFNCCFPQIVPKAIPPTSSAHTTLTQKPPCYFRGGGGRR